jgi:predicted ATP-grasp superfamily ATP-dependent carboligase
LNKPAEADFGKHRPGAIVLGGNFVGLGIVRSLGAHGIPTWVFDTDRSKSIAQFSRFTKRFVESKESVSDLLLAEGQRHELDGWVVFPVNDEYVESIATHHERLSSIYRLTTPPLEITKFALDKRLTYRRAAELGIATPWTSLASSLTDPGTKGIAYPVILKPAINHHFFPQTNLKVIPAENEQDLLRGLAQMTRYIPSEEILVQERIPGGGESQFSFCAACQDGCVYASLVAQRRRQYPVDFGNASSFVETIEQPVVESAGRRFLESIRYDGIAEVEFKFDSRDGRFKILDANLRAWGWHTLGKAAGIDFPYLLWRQKVGLPVASAAPVATHHKAAWVREITDFIAIAKSRHRAAELKRLLRAMGSGKCTLATFSFADPIPFFAEFVLWGSSGLSRKKKAEDFLKLNPPGLQR